METIPTSRERAPTGEDLRRLREGDPVVLDILARRATRLALRTSAAILGNRDEAADIAQDVAVEVLKTVHKLREPGAFDAWVHRITVRQALRHAGKRRKVSAAETPLDLLGELDEPGVPGAETRDAALDARLALTAALSRLPAKQRLALALRYVHDLSDDEIADALDCRRGTVHALLSRGRSSLRRDPRLLTLAPAVTQGAPR